MLEALLSQLTQDQFAEYGAIQVVEADFADNALHLRLEIHTGGEQHELHAWRIDCAGVEAHRLVLGPCLTVELVDDHPLLWPYTAAMATLEFKGSPADANAVVGALYQRHSELCDPWLAFNQFTSSLLPLPDLLELGEGMLAQGPEPVMRAYAEVLNALGLEAALLSDGEPAVPPGTFRVLLLGYSWIVAREFSAEPQNPA